MSSSSTIVSERHFDYLRRLTRPEPQVLTDLRAAAEQADIPAIWVSQEQASFMQILLKLHRAREVVEVGTLAGYSAINMAMALPADGRVRTIEIEPDRAKFAEAWAAKAGVADRVEVLVGAGATVLATMDTDSADVAFIDADKAGYPVYLQECVRIVRAGSLIMCDNAFAFGDLFKEGEVEDSVHAIRAFNDELAKRGDLHGIIAAIGDGCWVAVNEKG